MVDPESSHGTQRCQDATDLDKPAIKRDRAGHFVESGQASVAQPKLDKANAETRRRAAKSPPKGGEGDKDESRRRKLRT